LGNYQQRNFYVEFDLENEKFGFKQQSCAWIGSFGHIMIYCIN
jgi:hypothetical protein